MSNLEHLIENAMGCLEDFFDSGDKDVNAFNDRWRNSIITDVNYEGINISPDDIMDICIYFLCTWCGTCDKNWRDEKRGKWELIDKQEDEWIPTYTCSECSQSIVTYKCNYCPNCGADMRGEENDT